MTPTSLLVIDDDTDFNTLVKFIIKYDTNWEVLTTSDGQKGVSLTKLQQPSIILLDIIMPNLNGLEVYRLLKSDPTTCKIPIIFITAMVRMKKTIKDEINKDIEVIIKPFDIMKLVSKITNVCDLY